MIYVEYELSGRLFASEGSYPGDREHRCLGKPMHTNDDMNFQVENEKIYLCPLDHECSIVEYVLGVRGGSLSAIGPLSARMLHSARFIACLWTFVASLPSVFAATCFGDGVGEGVRDFPGGDRW